MPEREYVRKVDPIAQDWQHYSWSSGAFDSGRRAPTPEVEGQILVPHDLLLVTIDGGARSLEVTTECGHRYLGEDFAGAVSFLPAGCVRRMRMRDVTAGWASVSLRPDILQRASSEPGDVRSEVPAFTNMRDPLIASLVGEFVRIGLHDQTPETAYCDALTNMLAQVLVRRYSATQPQLRSDAPEFPAWQVRRLTDFVEAHLADRILVGDLAAVAGTSVGYLHRAFRATLDTTPHEFIQRHRIERARRLLLEHALSIVDVGFAVGFESPSHFARVFRRLTGISPSEYRKGTRRGRS